MTIVMDEEAFSSSITSLSSSANYQLQQQATLIEPAATASNTSYVVSASATMSSSSVSLNNSLVGNSSSVAQSLANTNGNHGNGEHRHGCPYVLFIFRPNASIQNGAAGQNSAAAGQNGAAAGQNGSVMVNGSGGVTGATSEPFDERKIYLDKPCKIGRSVAKLRPEPNNAIFDCKVLSRNHALLWEENTKFFIQDTKSSNGTFLNGNRLGKSNEDSEPFEITSGDIIQFGVDVTENTKKVTHGCITVEIRLFNKYGEEVVDRSQQGNKIDVQTQEIYQLAMFLQEAMMREEVLNKKLRTLQNFIDQAKENSEKGWLTLIQEDRLLSRIDFLEKQNLNNSKALSNDDGYKSIVNSVREEKLKVETLAKESIEKMVVEKNTLAQELDELRALFTNLTEEHAQLDKVNEENRTKIVDLAEANQELTSKLETSETELVELKKRQADSLAASETDKIKTEKLIQELSDKTMSLNAQVELLANEKELMSKKVQSLVDQLERERSAYEEERKKTAAQTDELCNNTGTSNNSDSIANHIDEEFVPNLIKEEKLRASTSKRLSDEFVDSLELSSTSPGASTKQSAAVAAEETERVRENLEAALERIEELETELSEKTRLVNELLLSKDELLNSKYKELDGLPDGEVCRFCYGRSAPGQLSLLSNASDLSVSVTRDDISANLDALQSKIETFFENLNNKSNESAGDKLELETIGAKESDLREMCKSLNELRVNLKQLAATTSSSRSARGGLGDESSNAAAVSFSSSHDAAVVDEDEDKTGTSRSLTASPPRSLKSTPNVSRRSVPRGGEDQDSSIRELEDEIAQKELEISGLREGYDDISLRARIVSYFSMIPLMILLLAIIIAFYPTLSTITATGL